MAAIFKIYTNLLTVALLNVTCISKSACACRIEHGQFQRVAFLWFSELQTLPATQLAIRVASARRVQTRHLMILTIFQPIKSKKCIYLTMPHLTPINQFSAPKPQFASPSKMMWGLCKATETLELVSSGIAATLVHWNTCIASHVCLFPKIAWKICHTKILFSGFYISLPVKVRELPLYMSYESTRGSILSSLSRPGKWIADRGLHNITRPIFWACLQGVPIIYRLHAPSVLPKTLIGTYCALVGSNPASRPNPKDVVSKLSKPGQYFNNDLIETLIFLEEIQIKDSNEKHAFFSGLTPKLDNIPDYVAKNKILPALLNAHEFSNVGSVVLSPMFKIGKLLDETEYQKCILPCVVKLFSSSDRATRLKLLQQIDTLAEHMSTQVINDQVFPPLCTGFLDNNPTIREHTVKAVIYLAPKLNYNNLNVEVMKHFARVQSKDDQGGIRTNTTVCLGKIAAYLHPETRQKCLVSAFTRAMRDPFPPSRTAGVMALAATQQYYPLSDVALKVFPILSHLTLDPEKSVRDHVFKVMKGFLSKLEKVSEDPSIREQME
ncbi:unnamed protein product, partial [Meganyctiphanes norvegica]